MIKTKNSGQTSITYVLFVLGMKSNLLCLGPSLERGYTSRLEDKIKCFECMINNII